MAAYCGFEKDQYDNVFIILDKMDKIGLEGIEKEMTEDGYPEEAIKKLLGMFEKITPDKAGILYLKELLKDELEPGAADNLVTIMETADAAKTADFRLRFDPTLVRGMGYYTGPIFEIGVGEFGSSVGGGGRYDEMIGKFTGNPVPAVGFSVGFERIIMLLMESGFEIPDSPAKKAYLLDKRLSDEKTGEVIRKAMEERAGGMEVTIAVMKKNKKFQKDQLIAQGYNEIEDIYAD